MNEQMGHSNRNSSGLKYRATCDPIQPVYNFLLKARWASGSTQLALIETPLDELLRCITVPVSVPSNNPVFNETTVSGWYRDLNRTAPSTVRHPEPLAFPCVVSAHGAWRESAGRIHVYNNAVLIDGAARLLLLVTDAVPKPLVPCIVFLDLPLDRDLILRRLFDHRDKAAHEDDVSPPIDTTTPRLVINTTPLELRIESDPFVVPTSLGYAPAVLILRKGNVHREHILIGAKSLATELEKIRRLTGTLKGSRISVCKESDERMAQYRVRRL
jgi:hypothetical protein